MIQENNRALQSVFGETLELTMGGQTESCINRLRASLSIIVQGVFSEVGKQTLDLHELIRARSLIIFNLRDSNFFSAEQADQLGKIVIYMVISTMQSIDNRGDRIASFLSFRQPGGFDFRLRCRTRYSSRSWRSYHVEWRPCGAMGSRLRFCTCRSSKTRSRTRL